MTMRRWLAISTIVLGSVGLTAQAPDVDALGPQVGARVPDFRLVDQNGRPHTLASAMGPKGAMLVFFRSADW
jgi:hypothetical protein